MRESGWQDYWGRMIKLQSASFCLHHSANRRLPLAEPCVCVRCLPRNWRSWVNKAENEAELDAMGRCVRRGTPLGDNRWMRSSTVRPFSSPAGEVRADGNSYKSDSPLTGDESRVLEVRDLQFPQLLDPVDDQPPSTVITHVNRMADGWLIRGSASDNGEIRRISVNGVPVRAVRENFAEWETVLSSDNLDHIMVSASDTAGNTEQPSHSLPDR